MTLLEALDIRIPHVKNKEEALTILKGHVDNEMLTEPQAQKYIDILYPIEINEILNEEGEVIEKVEVTKQKPLFTVEERSQRAELRAIKVGLREDIAKNKEYLAIDKPTATKTANQIKKLSRQLNGLMRLTIKDL